MDSRLKIEPILDMIKVRDFIIQPEIWDRYAEEGLSSDGFMPVYDAFTFWEAVYFDDELVGVILIHSDNSVSLRVHPYISKRYRIMSYDVMKLFCKWFVENVKGKVNKVNISIPKLYKKVINTAKKVGFVEEGVNRASYLKDGVYYDQVNLGITRSEMQECI